jgi:hypothetical protein
MMKLILSNAARLAWNDLLHKQHVLGLLYLSNRPGLLLVLF